MYFGKFDEGHSFIENKDESYLGGYDVSSFFEFDLDKFVCTVKDDSDENEFYVQLLDRGVKEVIVKVKNPAANPKVLHLVPVAHFDPEVLPYVFIRDKGNVTFYDTKNNKAHWVLKEIGCVGTIFSMYHIYDEELGKFYLDVLI